MQDLKYKICDKIVKKSIIKKYKKRVLSEEIIEKNEQYLEINYKNNILNYNLNGLIRICTKSDYPKNCLVDIITVNEKSYFVFTNEKQELFITNDLSKYLKFYSKALKTRITDSKIEIYILGYLVSRLEKDNFKINYKFMIGDLVVKSIDSPMIYKKNINKLKKLMNKKHFYKLECKIDDLISDEDNVMVNNGVSFAMDINGVLFKFPIKMKKRVKKSKYNYLPFLSKKVGNHFIMFRKSAKQNLMVIKREVETIENDKMFNFYESKFMNLIFKMLGFICKIINRKNINLYFEKFASKAEEGTFELFELARDNSTKSSNYYIIENNEENQGFLNKKNVVSKYSFKYYILVFAASNIISTEAPTHLNLLRTKNKSIKKAIYDKKFVFLQHGITYLKCQGKNSSFTKGKEAYPNLMVVSSTKEANVVSSALSIPHGRLIITGMPIFDKIKYNHIKEKSDNKVVIMLTWKPYEEQISDFSKSTYYNYTLNIYNILKKLIPEEDILIIPHPKVKEKMLSTPFGNSVYSGLISEVLKEGKLVITDYSSICYNSFYQGAGVVFYQPDIEVYEKDNGKLIPKDDEYIGYRCFNDKELNSVLNQGIKKGNISLKYFRMNEFINNYNLINEFHDGCNTKRIYDELIERNII